MDTKTGGVASPEKERLRDGFTTGPMVAGDGDVHHAMLEGRHA